MTGKVQNFAFEDGSFLICKGSWALEIEGENIVLVNALDGALLNPNLVWNNAIEEFNKKWPETNYSLEDIKAMCVKGG